MTESTVCASTALFPPCRSTGKQRDAESGLDHFQFRKPSSAMGRLMSPDPAGMMGGWPTLPRGTGVTPCTIETRGGAESFLRFLQKRFGF
jgi:uncharacterized protein RhaS with RHS repeats